MIKLHYNVAKIKKIIHYSYIFKNNIVFFPIQYIFHAHFDGLSDLLIKSDSIFLRKPAKSHQKKCIICKNCTKKSAFFVCS